MDALGDAADANPEKTVEILGGLRAKFDSLSPEEQQEAIEKLKEIQAKGPGSAFL